MNSFSLEIYQFLFFNIHIYMWLEMFYMSRLIVKHQLVSIKKDIVGVKQIVIFHSIIHNVDFYSYTGF